MKNTYIKCEENEGQVLVVDTHINCVSIMLPWEGLLRTEYVVAVSNEDLKAFKDAVSKMEEL